MTRQRTNIRVGQRLIAWDGAPGYVDLNSLGKRLYQHDESFRVVWLDYDGINVEDTQHYTLADFPREGIRFGRGLMPWAK